MPWDYDTSVERIRSHWDNIKEIEVQDLTRLADLQSLLSETVCRRIFGAHVYCKVTNFTNLISKDGAYSSDDYKRLIQGLHIYQREVSRIVEQTPGLEGVRVHFQGSTLHALFYRPVLNPIVLATKSVMLELVLRDFVTSVFNPAFPYYDDFSVSCGADIGYAVGTRNGMRGDRELLFLGAPANHAAKIIEGASGSRLTSEVYAALPSSLQDVCLEVNPEIYSVGKVSSKELDELLKECEICWDRVNSAAHVADDKKSFPLKDIDYSGAEVLIDFDKLSIHNNKRVLAASIFADVTGFTAFIDDSSDDLSREYALKLFHVIRREMATVLRIDYEGIRIQFQGDRVQGLFHLPKDDKQGIATKAVEAAIALQSSMEKALPVCVDSKDLHLAIGIDMGTTLATQLGTRGHRDRVCIGVAVENAAANEENCDAFEIGISSNIRSELPEYLSDLFEYLPSRGCYVAENLTLDKAQRLERSMNTYDKNSPVYIRSGNNGVRIDATSTPTSRYIPPTKPYATDE